MRQYASRIAEMLQQARHEPATPLRGSAAPLAVAPGAVAGQTRERALTVVVDKTPVRSAKLVDTEMSTPLVFQAAGWVGPPTGPEELPGIPLFDARAFAESLVRGLAGGGRSSLVAQEPAGRVETPQLLMASPSGMYPSAATRGAADSEVCPPRARRPSRRSA